MEKCLNTQWIINKDIEKNYLQCCLDCVNDEKVFKNFKQDERYLNILEHVSYDNSICLINEIGNIENIITKDILDKIKENDSIGNPSKYFYDFFGEISPSTIRYIKNSVDIVKNFTNVNNIVEIGGGYGGLCKTLYSIITPRCYTIIDLYEPLLLAIKYLKCFNIDIKTKSSNEEFDFSENIDLVISNYAFSELNKPLQEKYINEVLLKSNNFYVIYNNIHSQGMSFNEFEANMKQHFKLQVFEDYEKNKIIYGKDNSNISLEK